MLTDQDSYNSNLENSTDITDVEGNDDRRVFGWGANYPLDSVFIRQEIRTVRETMLRIKNSRFKLDPEFQRKFVWKKYKQSKLIESCLMRIPLPVFYVAEFDDGKIMIVDGLQRLTTFLKFIGNEFKLTFRDDIMNGTKSSLSGKSMRDLPLKFQERIEDTQLIFYILDENAPEQARLDIFDRVNSGEPLSRQQMRNALFCGPATKWLSSVVESDDFKMATDNSLNEKTMRDREAVNRFVSFTLCGWEEYNGDMDQYLAKGLRKLEKLSNSDKVNLKNDFTKTMNFCYKIFGVNSFRKSILESYAKRSLINLSLFDVMSVIFTKHMNSLENINSKLIFEHISILLKNDVFNKCITSFTSDTKAVKYRFQELENVIENLVRETKL